MSWKLPAIAAGVAILGVSSAVGLAQREDDGRFDDGPGLQVALFTPEAPPILEGARMEVGELVDGYVHRPRPPHDDGMDVYMTAWTEDEAWSPPPRDLGPPRDERPYAQPYQPRAVAVSEVDTIERSREGLGASLGFDGPSPDYATERRERRERREQRVREAAERAEVWPSSAELRPAETFY